VEVSCRITLLNNLKEEEYSKRKRKKERLRFDARLTPNVLNRTGKKNA